MYGRIAANPKEPPNRADLFPIACAQPTARIGVRRPAHLRVTILFAALIAGSSALLPLATAGSPAPLTTNSGFSCKVVFGSTPDALLIPGTSPTGTVGKGGAIGFQFEFEVQNFTSSQAGHVVYLPSATVSFATKTGSIQPFDLKHTLTITNKSWTSPTASSASDKISATVTFATGSSPSLSTQKLAVMANDGYGTIQLAFRWHWTVTYPNGSHATGPWTVPNSTAFHPSIFFAAPYVNVLSHTTSPVTLGTNYTATLTGAISKEPFFLELEFANNGNVVMAHGDTAPVGNSTPFVASILFNSYDGDLQPATMLVHIHNHCGSMLASISGIGDYASTSTVVLVSSTSSCPALVFNGTHYTSGAHITVKPSHTSISISAPTCTGHTFSDWTSTADLRVITGTHASTAVIATYNGTLEAHYA